MVALYVTPYNLVDRKQGFGRTYFPIPDGRIWHLRNVAPCLPHQTASVPEDRNLHIDHRELDIGCFSPKKPHDFLMTYYLLYIQTLDQTLENVMIFFSTSIRVQIHC